MKRLTKAAVAVVLLALALFLLSCGGFIAPVEFIVCLVGGWLLFLVRVVFQAHIDWGSVAFASSLFLGFVGGLHALLRSFTRSSSAAGTEPHEDNSHRPPVRLSTTLACSVIVLFAFVAGISMVGITHQLSWLFTDKTPILSSKMSSVFRMRSSNNLKQIGIATHDYAEHAGYLPRTMLDDRGDVLHSWMTVILPYVEQQALYDKLDLTRSWNSDVNREWFTQRLQVYENPGLRHVETVDGSGPAHYAMNMHLAGVGKPVAFSDVFDGTAKTIWIGEINEGIPPWGRPGNWRDPAIGLGTSPHGFSAVWPGGGQFTFVDGSVHFLSDQIDPEVLRALATPAGGERIKDGDF